MLRPLYVQGSPPPVRAEVCGLVLDLQEQMEPEALVQARQDLAHLSLDRELSAEVRAGALEILLTSRGGGTVQDGVIDAPLGRCQQLSHDGVDDLLLLVAATWRLLELGRASAGYRFKVMTVCEEAIRGDTLEDTAQVLVEHLRDELRNVSSSRSLD